jgi:hypothetical protein
LANRTLVVQELASTTKVVAMKVTGHRNDAMFRRYAIVNEEQNREALARTQEYGAAAASRKVGLWDEENEITTFIWEAARSHSTRKLLKEWRALRDSNSRPSGS